jgi:hypothetical protein
VARIVPSQVVQFIDQVFPFLREGQGAELHRNHAGEAAGLLRLVDSIPEELISISGREYVDYVCSVAAIRERLDLWRNVYNPNISMSLGPMMRGLNPVTMIRSALSNCHDEYPSRASAGLAFLSDQNLRENLRIDISAANRALVTGEWKAVTVLAGSIVEAILLWAIQEKSPAEFARVTAISPKLPSTAPDEWHLPDYIVAAERLSILKPNTVIHARLTKDFRNLIHPGRARRLGQQCNRGTALAALASVELVILDVTP